MKNLKFLFLFCLFFSQQTAVHAQLFGGSIKSPARATVASLTCGAATLSPASFNANVSYTGTATVPYTGGNGAAYGAGTGIGSTGVPGLTAALQAGTLTTGAGNLIYNITGTPSANGVASFAISFAGFNCSLTLSSCGAFVATGVFKGFLCHNLGADTSLDPHTPVKGINGDYYQWGRNAPAADVDNLIGAWGSQGGTSANGNWTPNAKGPQDPCPAGYRVPSQAEWAAVNTYNIPSRTGVLPWVEDIAEFGNALHYGPDASTKLLTLPAAGGRLSANGASARRGGVGSYWSSVGVNGPAYNLGFNSNNANPAPTNPRTFGFTVRCIAE
jgi:uncharacterized protein (TIGR02145 family)